jgi:hypothetical protein
MKKIIIVSYNITNTSSKFQSVIQSQPQWLKILNSTWLIATTETVTQFYNKLQPYIDGNNDRLFIGVITSEYQGWLSRNIWDWIKQNQDAV